MSNWNFRNNRVVWFDIPVRDLDRAAAFYGEVLSLPIHRQRNELEEFGVIDHKEGNGGCLLIRPGEPHDKGGVLIYLNVDGRIRDAVGRVEALGGRVLEPVGSMGPHGYRAIVLDSEGNRVALHSTNDA